MFVADETFCISLNRLRLVVTSDNIPQHNDPDHSLAIFYEDSSKKLILSYTNKDKRDFMRALILSTLGTSVNFGKICEKEPE